MIGKSLNIQQEGERIEISNDISKLDKNSTISVFFKINNLSNQYNEIFDKTAGSDYSLNIKVVDNTNMLRFTVHNGSEYQTIETSVLSNILYNVVILRDDSTIRFYLNGTLNNTVKITNIYNRDIPLIIGAGGSPYDSGYGFNGLIDDLRIYDRALNEAEIKELYEMGGINTSGADEIHVNNDNGHKYYIYNQFVSWKDAKSSCEQKGLYLATITSEDENNFIKSWLNQLTNDHYWLGGTDEEQEGVWRWVSGEEWTYSYWNSGEPNDLYGEDYLHLYTHNHNNKWNDLPNSTSRRLGYICED